ncbi:MAG: UDP-N-acetylmuramate--L-alanine ligase [Chitinophagaceae bacterium]|nr:UDP-N-acetylmuramate--L-alanine ligase [Chitinophagaceae bacterium]
MTGDTNISRVYFIGIGGIGMSALARYFLERGAVVEGYDRALSPNIEQLIEEGASVHFEADTNLLDKEAQLVVYTPAIPGNHAELIWYRENGYAVKKRSEVLEEITKGGYNICIAGTHGKTTMSTMTAHILRHSGYGCNAFLGGMSINYGTNYWKSENNVNVVEADEYDRSFLKLNPNIAVISAMEADHLEVYGSLENMKGAFGEFTERISDDGVLIHKFGLDIKSSFAGKRIRYSLQNDSADVYAENIVMKNGGYHFDVVSSSWRIDGFRLNMIGMVNVENMVASVCIAHELKIDEEKIKEAVSAFIGIKRRFEYIINPDEAGNKVVYIDDYAHHPAELKAMLTGVRSLFNNRWMTVIFQPHLYTRTRDYYEEFAESLAIANTVVLLPVYPAREEPIDDVSSELISDAMEKGRAVVKTKEELLKWLKTDYKNSLPHALDGDVLVTAGAGDISELVQPIREIILNN